MESKLKHFQYAELVSNRKQCRRCVGLRNPAEPELAEFDSCEIGPWSRLHGDLNAPLMIIGQDWGDVRYFQAHQGLDDLRNPTMQVLEMLLRGINHPVSLSAYNANPQGIFLTNAVLCLKEGGLQGKVQREWFVNCGIHFLEAQIRLVAPRVVVTLGNLAFQATLAAFSLEKRPLRKSVDDEAPILLPNGAQLVPVYHCGRRILNTHRCFKQQEVDWQRVGKALGSLHTCPESPES